jgi:uncharacterized protein
MLKQKLQSDQLEALKTKKNVRLTTLRYILSQIKNKEIEKKTEASDDEIMTIIRKAAKELKESIDAFQKGNRPDLVNEYQQQLEVVNAYLPAEISDEELKKAIGNLIEQNQEAYRKNPKTIIGICMRELKNKADPGRIMKVLNSLI